MNDGEMKMIELKFEVEEKEADALAQFLKRVGWSEVRGCAVDDEEAHFIQGGLYRLEDALNELGFDPR